MCHASASVGSNPAEPAGAGSTRPAPPKGTILDSSAPKSSSPMTVRSIVPSSLFETKSRSSSRRTPRPCKRSTSANTRPWKSEPGPKLIAITCKGPGICRPPRTTQERPRGRGRPQTTTDMHLHPDARPPARGPRSAGQANRDPTAPLPADRAAYGRGRAGRYQSSDQREPTSTPSMPSTRHRGSKCRS